MILSGREPDVGDSLIIMDCFFSKIKRSEGDYRGLSLIAATSGDKVLDVLLIIFCSIYQ
jgi:hypothetical protein